MDPIRQAAIDTGEQIVSTFAHDRRALVAAIARLAEMGLRCAAQAYRRECLEGEPSAREGR